MTMKRYLSFLPQLLALLIALLSGVLLFNTSVISALVSTIISVGLDPLRAQLLAALMMTAGAALLAAIGGRRKLGAMLGAAVVFWFGYLAGFIQLERQPFYDPGGNLEPLNTAALVHTSCVMLALAFLGAFIGAAVGVALGEVLLDPPYRLARLIWARSARTRTHVKVVALSKGVTGNRISKARTAASWLGAATMIALIVLASSASDLIIFSPDIGLHTAPAIHHGHVSAHSIIVQDEVVSPALGGQRRPFLVYLPPSYNTPEGQTKRYPTLYLLHGSPGKDSDWFNGGKADQSADTLIALGKIPELILILPDGNGRRGQPSEWGNAFDHHQNIETYIATDLIKYVDAHYRTIADAAHRGIGGLSMGGFGAMNIALHHPDIFGTVISLGGYYRAEGSIWGRNVTYAQENSPIDVLLKDKPAWGLHMYIGAATKDQPYYTLAKQFVGELVKLHLSYQLDVQNGYHSWRVWQVQIYNALLWLHWVQG
jgi:enterochelin esterase-like enzyme